MVTNTRKESIGNLVDEYTNIYLYDGIVFSAKISDI